MLGMKFLDTEGNIDKEFAEIYGSEGYEYENVFWGEDMDDELCHYGELLAYTDDERGIEFLVEKATGKIVQTIAVEWKEEGGINGINLQTA